MFKLLSFFTFITWNSHFKLFDYMASNTDVVKKLYYNMSVLCLYLCVCMSVANIAPISKPHLQNSHNFLQCPSSTKFKDGRACWPRFWRSTCGYTHIANYTSVDRNALTALHTYDLASNTMFKLWSFFNIYICFFILLRLNLWTWSTLHFIYQYFRFTFGNKLLLSFRHLGFSKFRNFHGLSPA